MRVRRTFLSFLLILPLTGAGQSFEWYERRENPPWTDDLDDPGDVYPSHMVASEHGIYSLGLTDCIWFGNESCYGVLTKYSADDGKLLWQRRQSIEAFTTSSALAVNELGVFVVGGFSPGDGTYIGYPETGSFVRHYNHSGDTVWTVRDWQRDRSASGIAIDADGLYVIGSSLGHGGRAVIRHIDFTGQRRWVVDLPYDTEYGETIIVADGLLYALTQARGIDVLETDGNFVERMFPAQPAILEVYHDGYFYGSGGDGVSEYGVTKYTSDGDVVWHTSITPDEDGLRADRYLVVSDDGLVVQAAMTVPDGTGFYSQTGYALIKLDFNGSIVDVAKFPGFDHSPFFLSVLDGTVYVTGLARGADAVFTARVTDADLLAPSLLSLAGAAPTQPPRLAVLQHDYGAGPVRARTRDAAPGSLEYVTEFSEGLKPVAFGKAGDLDGNGYEELVVVSRFPAVAEVRDSLDGSLLSSFKLGPHFDPVAAVVEERAGESPRLAVLVRNPSNERILVRVHDLATGVLLDSIYYQPGLTPIDVVALPDSGNSHRYAVLTRSPPTGAPHRIEIRDTSDSIENYFVSPSNTPLELALTGTAGSPALAVLMDYSAAYRPLVRQIEAQGGGGLTLRYSSDFTPVAMAVVPDIDGNAYPEATVLSTKSSGQVKAETRDGQSGVLQHRITLDRDYEPQDVAYVGPIAGFSDSALGFLQRQNTDGWLIDATLHAVLVDAADGTPLFELAFPVTP